MQSYRVRFLVCMLVCQHGVVLANTEATTPNAQTAVKQDNTKQDSTNQDDSWLDGIRSRLHGFMRGTAQWLDDWMKVDHEGEAKEADASGYVRLGWEPREGDWQDASLRFRVRMHLPYWKDRVDLLLQDSDDDLARLPFESSRPTQEDFKAKDMVAALRVTHGRSDNARFSSRLGISRSQLYARTEYQYGKVMGDWSVKAVPAVEYYWSEGWGARILLEGAYQISEATGLSLSTSVRDIQEWAYPEWKAGLFFSHAFSDKRIGVAGIMVRDALDKQADERVYTVSFRYRQQIFREWFYFELEPFVDYAQQQGYQSETGLALRVLGYFGDDR